MEHRVQWSAWGDRAPAVPGGVFGGGVEGGWALSYVFSKISEFPKIAPNKSFGNS